MLERAVVMLLEPIYEGDFLDCSYGFRPKRSAQQALGEIRGALMEMGGGWVLDVDIRKYFDTIPHALLQQILRKRVKDKVIVRLVGKWLKAGVWEDGVIHANEEGTPQGGVISPMLSNIYLHEVLDRWFHGQIVPGLKGRAHLVRFADDFVMILERREEAEALLRLLPERFAQYGLTIHPEKTRLVDFRHPWTSRSKPGTFDFLGFTHHWGKTLRGGYAVIRKTAAKKLRKALTAMGEWCKAHRHRPVSEQHRQICAKLRGHYAYYGIAGNQRSLAVYQCQVQRLWRYWLNRRSRKNGMSWKRFGEMIRQAFPLPPPRLVHGAPMAIQITLDL